MIFFRNVLRAPARSLMTALGIAIGVALFVAVTAITMDLHAQMEGAASDYKLEVVVYERRSTSPFSSRISPAQMSELQKRFGQQVTPLVMGSLNEKWNAYAMIIGAGSEFRQRIPLTTGTGFAEGSEDVLIGEIASQNLHLGAGDRLHIDGRSMRVSGIFRTGSRLFDGGIMTNIASAQRMLTREGAEIQFTMALMQSTQADNGAQLIADINRDYPSLKAIAGTEFAGALRLIRVVEAFVKTISVVTLLGTCLVVSNTMMMAIAERTREIGILMAVGWTPWLIVRMLFSEALVLCTAGAVLGNLFALALLRVVNGLDSVGFGWIPIRFSWSLSLTSLAMALSVAVLSLLWPAFVIYRMQPLAALRHE